MVFYNGLCKHWVYSAVSKKHFFFTKQAACQLLKEKSEKNFAESGARFYVGEFSKDNHNKCNVTYRKEIGDSVGIFKFQPDLISNLKLENDYSFTGIVCYAKRCREITMETLFWRICINYHLGALIIIYS